MATTCATNFEPRCLPSSLPRRSCPRLRPECSPVAARSEWTARRFVFPSGAGSSRLLRRRHESQLQRWAAVLGQDQQKLLENQEGLRAQHAGEAGSGLHGCRPRFRREPASSAPRRPGRPPPPRRLPPQRWRPGAARACFPLALRGSSRGLFHGGTVSPYSLRSSWVMLVT